jgi:hypothetical protein
LFAYFGNTIRVYYRKRRKERGKTKKQNMRRALRLGRFWMRYGIWGISVISPFISPMVAVFIALTFREKPNRIIRHIGLAIVISSFLIALIGEIRILWRI